VWSCWKSPKGDVLSYTMLTINADDHALMNHFHKPTDEKRMVVILPPQWGTAWNLCDPIQPLPCKPQRPKPSKGRFYDSAFFCPLCLHGQYLPQSDCRQ
jgi:putative SOS response-associated peptidase YedK